MKEWRMVAVHVGRDRTIHAPRKTTEEWLAQEGKEEGEFGTGGDYRFIHTRRLCSQEKKGRGGERATEMKGH